MDPLLKEWVFELNTYDAFVVDKTFYEKQCTILQHAYDLNISHFGSTFVDSIIKIFY